MSILEAEGSDLFTESQYYHHHFVERVKLIANAIKKEPSRIMIVRDRFCNHGNNVYWHDEIDYSEEDYTKNYFKGVLNEVYPDAFSIFFVDKFNTISDSVKFSNTLIVANIDALDCVDCLDEELKTKDIFLLPYEISIRRLILNKKLKVVKAPNLKWHLDKAEDLERLRVKELKRR